MKKSMMTMILLTVGIQLAGCTFGEPQMGDMSTEGTRATAPLESVYETQNQAVDRNENRISEQEAREIALERVPGAIEEDIREFKLDYDDGRPEYEGKIYFEKNEYEFEIDGYTGEIRHWEVELIRD